MTMNRLHHHDAAPVSLYGLHTDRFLPGSLYHLTSREEQC